MKNTLTSKDIFEAVAILKKNERKPVGLKAGKSIDNYVKKSLKRGG